MSSLFKIDIGKLRGVGPKIAELFRSLGVYTIADILRFFPRDYEDWTQYSNVCECVGKKDVCVKAKVVSSPSILATKSGKKIYKFLASDGFDTFEVVFFGSVFVVKNILKGSEYIFRGTIARKYDMYQMASPKIQKIEQANVLVPVYKQKAGLSSKKINNFVKEAFAMLPENMGETLPENVIEENHLCSLKFAFENLHFPKNKVALEEARRRVIFEEFFVYRLGVGLVKKQARVKTSIVMPKDGKEDFLKLLPFKMTKSQLKVVNECLNDMKSSKYAMNRLLQGDVGSGKTAVAALLAYTAALNGYQAVIMAPTELLATQHYETFKKFFKDSVLKVGLVCGSLRTKEKNRIQDEIFLGEINIVVGTHALFSENMKFKNLGLVITDEQHRFGVNQRASLINKGNAPHVLVMSATPIPRSLALILYGDLDISVIDETIPGRQKIDTFGIDSSKRHRMWEFFKKIINEGGQGYIVCAGIEESENNILDVNSYYEDMIKYGFESSEIGILHGKMRAIEKDIVMNDFATGKIKILIATTIIEVGIDVPNARIIAIENAERFGLSQLHQLRGRVGRGNFKSYCILCTDSKSVESKRRINAMENSSDGFFLSEEDLKIRGPGDFFGVNQHGVPNIKIATSFKDFDIVQSAKESASKFLKEFDINDFKFLKHRIEDTFHSNDCEKGVIF